MVTECLIILIMSGSKGAQLREDKIKATKKVESPNFSNRIETNIRCDTIFW